MSATAERRRFSIVIPVFNAEATLARCLEAVLAQTTDADEVIVVDDGSSDRSAAIARRYPVRLFRNSQQRGVSASRNRGAAEARGRLLFFTDADAVIGAGVLARIQEQLEVTRAAAAVVGIYAERCGATNAVSRFKNAWIRFSYLCAPERITWTFGCLFAIPRALFGEMGGFASNYTCRRGGGDINLGLRLTRAGHQILLDRRLEVVHLRRYTLRGLLWNDLSRCAGYTSLGLQELGLRRLLRERRFANIDASFLSCVLLAGALLASLAALPLLPALWPLPPALFLIYLTLNLRFYRILARSRLLLPGAALLLASHAACLPGIPFGVLRAIKALAWEIAHGHPASHAWVRKGRVRRFLLSRTHPQ